MITAVRHGIRLVGILRTLRRHDALFPLADIFPNQPLVVWFVRRFSPAGVPGRPGERLAAALTELGPSFVKLGQSLSTRSDLIGDRMAADLARLQDRLPPFPTAAAIATIETELERPIEAAFLSFDPVPVAAASIAQVHFATTPEGEVAVKILRPGIEAAMMRDVQMFFWLARLVERFGPSLRRLRPYAVVATFAETIRMEMDLRLEAAGGCELADDFAEDPDFRVPRIDWSRTARRVLTLERVTGIKLDERERLIEAGHDPVRILGLAANAFFAQVFRHGYFHADMHAGNVFVRADGVLVPVDFGIMGRLDRRTRNYLADMLLGFLTRDYRRVAEVHFRAGYVPPGRSLESFAQACRSIGEPILERPLEEISVARLLGQLFEITEVFAMETQPQLLLLQKTMLMAEGLGRRLAPEVNIWNLARPLIEEWMIENRGPEARLREAGSELARTLERIPRVIDAVEKAADRIMAEPFVKDMRQAARPLELALIAIALAALLVYALR